MMEIQYNQLNVVFCFDLIPMGDKIAYRPISSPDPVYTKLK